ncbi:regulator of telomere elongation helicase 1 [Striga asiatica]|uniref:Regulator of telomere elongation helicase 1 n=1 Tax=Striga asiatica TaxID=4170 RepID=A0A5A7PGI6_STRAF|nr:regulator of telomere elongation helicase 1 [Striga asiatica]
MRIDSIFRSTVVLWSILTLPIRPKSLLAPPKARQQREAPDEEQAHCSSTSSRHFDKWLTRAGQAKQRPCPKEPPMNRTENRPKEPPLNRTENLQTETARHQTDHDYRNHQRRPQPPPSDPSVSAPETTRIQRNTQSLASDLTTTRGGQEQQLQALCTTTRSQRTPPWTPRV